MKNRGIKDVKTKSKFLELISNAGYESVEQFSQACNLQTTSVFLHIRGKYRPSLDRIFIYARVLDTDIDTIIRCFYEKEMKEQEGRC